MSLVCLKCSTQNENNAVYCDQCGAILSRVEPRREPIDLPGMIPPQSLAPRAVDRLVCKKCGYGAKMGDLFCINCGTSLASLSPPPSPAPSPRASQANLPQSMPPPSPSAQTYLVSDASLPLAAVLGVETRVLTTGRLIIGNVEIQLPPQLDVTLGRQDPYAQPPWRPDVDLTAYGAGDPAYGVSRRHARLRWAGEWTIEDLNSANGTFIGIERISECKTLHDGDQIMLGRLVMTFRQE